jgi:hypothetical protein
MLAGPQTVAFFVLVDSMSPVIVVGVLVVVVVVVAVVVSFVLTSLFVFWLALHNSCSTDIKQQKCCINIVAECPEIM